MSDISSVNNTVDSALASYGRAKTYMSTIFGSSILTIFLIVGIFILNRAIKNKNNYKSTEAKVLSIRPSGKNNYIATVSYTVSDKTYEGNVNLSYYRGIGSYVTVYYDIYNPNSVETYSPTYEILVGSGLIVCVLLSCALMFYNAYMVKNSDFAAQDAAFTTSYNSYGSYRPYQSRSLISIF
jgi:hypothetical protein